MWKGARTYGRIQVLTEDPDATMPRARARRFENQEPTKPVAAEKMAAAPMALQMDCERRIW